jgi:hypothetical protein
MTEREAIYPDHGITLYWRDGDDENGPQGGLKADERGFWYLAEKARERHQTVEQYAYALWADAFGKFVNVEQATYTNLSLGAPGPKCSTAIDCVLAAERGIFAQ